MSKLGMALEQNTKLINELNRAKQIIGDLTLKLNKNE